MWYSINDMKTWNALGLLALLLGCAPANVNPGMTFLVGLNGYQEEMDRLSSMPERWPDRQSTAESLKTTYVATLGGSKEFNRLVDLDLRRREFLIVLRDQTPKPERVKEMQAELVSINRDVDGLKEIVKGQTDSTLMLTEDQSQRVETIATIGLLNIALDDFSASSGRGGLAAPSTKVGENVVTHLGGSLSTVKMPDGQTYRCSTILVQDEGAGIKCDPLSGAK